MHTRTLTTLVLAATLSACGGPPKPIAPTLNTSRPALTFTAVGRGALPDETDNPTQARLMAERAARVDAYRKLSEQIYGVQVKGQTTVRDAMLESDAIDTNVNAYLRAAQVTETRFRPELGLVEVELKLTLGSRFYELFTR